MIKLPTPRAISPGFSAWLDFFRWSAAFAVTLAHTRAGVMVDFSPAMQPGWLARAVYFLPGFAHSAVMVFFVLSGYLVGGEILRAFHRGDFSWRHYAARRVARLYTVYLVVLLLCALWDNLGLHFFNARQFYTAHDNYYTMITYPITERLTLPVFFGNLLFCQTILVPTLGSNGALWTLANEAWYYALFPLALWPLCTRGAVRGRIISVALLAAGAWFVGREILLYFSIWLLGLVPHFLPGPLLRRVWPAALAFVGMLLLDRFHVGGMAQFGHDFFLSVALVLLLNALEFQARPVPGPAALHRELAGFSYSIYLVHWPLALLLIAILDRAWGFGARLPFSLAGVAYVLVLLAVIYGFSWALAQLTERNTARVRSWLLRHTGGEARPRPAGPAGK